jgi:acetyl esterase/lipase
LAAVLSLKAALASPPIPLLAQLLILPVIDNTATSTSAIWTHNRLAPWLTPGRMLWYRQKYLPESKDCLEWTASPNLAPREILQRSPKSWIAVAEFDLLAPEGIAYGQQLTDAGVAVDTKTYKGSTHSLLALSGECKVLLAFTMLPTANSC